MFPRRLVKGGGHQEALVAAYDKLTCMCFQYTVVCVVKLFVKEMDFEVRVLEVLKVCSKIKRGRKVMGYL